MHQFLKATYEALNDSNFNQVARGRMLASEDRPMRYFGEHMKQEEIGKLEDLF